MGKKSLENHFPDKPALMFVEIRTVFQIARFYGYDIICIQTHNMV